MPDVVHIACSVNRRFVDRAGHHAGEFAREAQFGRAFHGLHRVLAARRLHLAKLKIDRLGQADVENADSTLQLGRSIHTRKLG